MSTSNGGVEPPSNDEASSDGSVPVVDESENPFEVSVEAGAVVTADTSLSASDSAGGDDDGFSETDPALSVADAGSPGMAFDQTMDEISFNAAVGKEEDPSEMAFDQTMDEMSFNAAMDEAEFSADNSNLPFGVTEPELEVAVVESTDPGLSTGFGAITAEPQAPTSDSEVETLRRQLDSARSELRIVVSQLNDLEKIRSYALQRGSEILMLKARQVSLESEVDLYRELTEDYRVKCHGLEVQLRDVSGDDDGLGLGEADAEIGTLQEELAQATRGRDEAVQEAERLRADMATLRESDSRAPLLARIEELEAALAQAGTSGDAGEEQAQLEARAHALQADLFKAQSDVTDAEQRADRLKIALERLRQAFVKTAEQSERVPALEGEVETLKTSLAEAQAAPPESAGAYRIEELGTELATARERIATLEAQGSGHDQAFQAQLDELTAELESARALSGAIEDGNAAEEVVALRRKTTDLEIQVSDLTRQLEEAADRVAGAPSRGADAGEGGDRLERLRIAVQRSSAQVQRLLLELEGSRGSVQRARRDMQRYSRSVNALHESLNHLERYLIGAGPQAQQGVVLLQEVKRCAHDVRAMVESNERFGRSMSKVVERLSGIVSEA